MPLSGVIQDSTSTDQQPPDQDGLPGLNGQGGDDLPGLKKKDQSADSSSSPSASTPTPTQTVTPPATSVSKSDLHQNLFGVKSKDDTTPADTNLFADSKGSLIDKATKKALEKATTDQQKQAINMRKHELTTKFFSGQLDGKDVGYISDMISPGTNGQGLDDDTIANAINNKTKNLRVWANINVMKGVENSTKELAGINKQLAYLDAEVDRVGILGGVTSTLTPEQEQKRKELHTQRDFLQNSISTVYEAEKNRVMPKILSDLKNNIHSGKDWDQIMDESYHAKTKDEEIGLDRPYQQRPDYFIEYNPKSNTLTKESAASILKFGSDWKEKNKNQVLEAGPSEDIGVSLINYLNTVPVIDKHKKIFTENWKNKNKEYAPLIDHQQQVQDYFTPEHIKASEAVVKPWQDKQFVLANEKYYGKNGILTTNPELVALHHKYAEAVGRNEMTPEVAKKQIEAEIENTPSLQKISKQYEAEVRSIQNKGQQMYADFITNGIQSSIDPNLVFYKSGNVGVKGKSEAQSRSAMEQYNQGVVENAGNTLHNQNVALNLDADQRARRFGSFTGSLRQAGKEQLGAFYNWYFHKTGWDGDNARMFQAEQLSEIPVSQSDVAKAWNWEGMKSLINPNFYASKVASMLPVIAPSAVMTAATEGAGLPEAVSWLGSAGVFTAQDAMSFHNSLQNTTDKFGRKLTDSEVDDITARQVQEEFFPNLALMGLNLGTLSRAKAITKPTVGRAIKEAVVGSALGTVPMAVQGYLSYANQLRAQGNTPDMFDYMQDDHFANSMIDGFVGGLGIQLAHAPSNYVQKIKNWKTMIAGSEGEFRDNSMYNVALQHHMNGNGQQFNDAIKLHLFNGFEGSPQEKANLEHLLQYSTALDRNFKADKTLDPQNIHDLYQAHNLALADLHDNLAETNKNNKNLSKIYADQAKDYREQAKSVVEGKAKFHYLMDRNDEPVFISDNSFKHLDANGDIAKWLDNGNIKSIHNSEDPNFDSEYKKGLQTEQEEEPRRPPVEPKFEEGNVETIIQALKDHRNEFSAGGEAMYGDHLEDPTLHEQLATEIISQAADHQGNMEDAIGPSAFKKIKPIIDEQIEIAKPKVEDLPPLREKDEARMILKQDIPDALGRKNITVDGESVPADEAIGKLKEKHGIIDDIIKNCL
jgi:hypothetical protein